MELLTCTKRERNKQGQIVKYTLTDGTSTYHFGSRELKHSMLLNEVEVTNLELTSDYRLIFLNRNKFERECKRKRVDTKLDNACLNTTQNLYNLAGAIEYNNVTIGAVNKEMFKEIRTKLRKAQLIGAPNIELEVSPKVYCIRIMSDLYIITPCSNLTIGETIRMLSGIKVTGKVTFNNVVITDKSSLTAMFEQSCINEIDIRSLNIERAKSATIMFMGSVIGKMYIKRLAGNTAEFMGACTVNELRIDELSVDSEEDPFEASENGRVIAKKMMSGREFYYTNIKKLNIGKIGMSKYEVKELFTHTYIDESNIGEHLSRLRIDTDNPSEFSDMYNEYIINTPFGTHFTRGNLMLRARDTRNEHKILYLSLLWNVDYLDRLCRYADKGKNKLTVSNVGAVTISPKLSEIRIYTDLGVMVVCTIRSKNSSQSIISSDAERMCICDIKLKKSKPDKNNIPLATRWGAVKPEHVWPKDWDKFDELSKVRRGIV